MKRFAALAVAAAFAVGFAGPTASAGCEVPGPSVSESDGIENPATGGYVYADGGESGAVVGIAGDVGYLEVNVDLDAGSAQVHGEENETGENIHGNVGTDVQCLPVVG